LNLFILVRKKKKKEKKKEKGKKRGKKNNFFSVTRMCYEEKKKLYGESQLIKSANENNSFHAVK
jgi:hypothetical protein